MRHVSQGLDELTARAYELVDAGDLARARTELEDGLAESEFDGSTVPPELAEAASLYARLLLTGGQTEEAREWAAYAYGAAERLYGAADQRAVRDAATLAAALSRVGELPTAERLYRDVVARLSERDGPGSPQALAARADLATVLHATGQCRAARSELAGALAAHQAGYGVHEAAGIRMLARLAAMSRDCGDEAAARRHFARAGALAEAYLPAAHPVAAQAAALAAAPADATHPCQVAPAAPTQRAAEDGPQWWPPEQDAEPTPPGEPGGRAEPTREVRALTGRPMSRGHLAAPRRISMAGQPPFAEALAEPAGAHHPPRPPAGPPLAAPQAPPARPAPAPYEEPYEQPYEQPEHTRSRWATASFAAGLAVLGVAGGWFAANSLIGDDRDRTTPPAAPVAGTSAAPRSPAGPAAPGGLALRDGFDSVTLVWTYPSGAEGPVLVAGGRTGVQRQALQTLAPGTTTLTMYGLDERADYCFTVAVVYSTDSVARSAPVCTSRPRGRPPATR
jgi:hypothetical protein